MPADKLDLTKVVHPKGGGGMSVRDIKHEPPAGGSTITKPPARTGKS